MSEDETERDLTTTRSQVFGDVKKGAKCRVCGRSVEDGRSKTCSDYCNNLFSAVMGMLNWTSVRRKIIDRDDETCQVCGFDHSKERKAQKHILALIDEAAGERPESPSLEDIGGNTDVAWDNHRKEVEAWRGRKEDAKEWYGDPYEAARSLEVDHIVPVSEGGHPFDPANLQTLCEECHRDKTARENSKRGQTPSRGDLSESLFTCVADGREGSGITGGDGR
jgi:5-methylcytosine-specific restriction endonuclease McrA